MVQQMTSSCSSTSLKDSFFNLLLNTSLNCSLKTKSTVASQEYKLWTAKHQTKNVQLLACKSINYEWQNWIKQNKEKNREVVWQPNRWQQSIYNLLPKFNVQPNKRRSQEETTYQLRHCPSKYQGWVKTTSLAWPADASLAPSRHQVIRLAWGQSQLEPWSSPQPYPQ